MPRPPNKWLRKAAKLLAEIIDGVGFSLVTIPTAVWIAVYHSAQVGYSIALIVIGFVLAILTFRAVITRLKRRERLLEEHLKFMLNMHPETYLLFADTALVEGPELVVEKVTLVQRCEQWMALLRKYSDTMFRVARLFSGLACIAGGIAFLFFKDAPSWASSSLLVTGGLFLGARTLLDRLKPPRNRK